VKWAGKKITVAFFLIDGGKKIDKPSISSAVAGAGKLRKMPANEIRVLFFFNFDGVWMIF